MRKSPKNELSYQKRRLMKGLGLTSSLKPMTDKELVINAVRRLPDKTSWEEAFNLTYFLRRINDLLTEFEEGRLVPEEAYQSGGIRRVLRKA